MKQKQYEIYVQDMKMCNYILAKPHWLRSKQRNKMGLVINMLERNNVEN